MYLISTKHTKWRNGGYRDCRVFHMSSVTSHPYDVTNQVADRFWLTYYRWNIRIHFGSWTWAMVIKQCLEQHNIDPMNHSLKIMTADVSVF